MHFQYHVIIISLQYWWNPMVCQLMSWYGSTFHIIGPLWGDSLITTGFPSQRANNADRWWFLCCHLEQVVEKGGQVASDLKVFRAHIDRLVPETDSKVHGANMGPTWVLLAPDGPHVGPVNLAVRVSHQYEARYVKCWEFISLVASAGIESWRYYVQNSS